MRGAGCASSRQGLSRHLEAALYSGQHPQTTPSSHVTLSPHHPQPTSPSAILLSLSRGPRCLVRAVLCNLLWSRSPNSDAPSAKPCARLDLSRLDSTRLCSTRGAFLYLDLPQFASTCQVLSLAPSDELVLFGGSSDWSSYAPEDSDSFDLLATTSLHRSPIPIRPRGCHSPVARPPHPLSHPHPPRMRSHEPLDPPLLPFTHPFPIWQVRCHNLPP